MSRSAYTCADRGKWHEPLHGRTKRPGELHMRTDNCIYCTKRIISLHVGVTLEDRTFDLWRTVDSVKPSMIIQEEPF